MKKPIRVLVVEDSEFDARILIGTLKQGGYDPIWRRVESASTMREALQNETWEVVLSDYNLPEFSAPDALRLLQESGLDLPFVIISGGIGEDVAVASMKAGAHDYLMKGNLARLVPAVEREMREAEVRHGRRRAEEALRDSELRYRMLWENSTDAVLLMNEQGTIQFASPAVSGVFGCEPVEVVGREFQQLLVPEAREGVFQWIDRHLTGEAERTGRQPMETLGCHKSGRQVSLEIAFSHVTLKGERLVVAFIRDITERRRAEEEIRLLQTISVAVNAAQDLDTALSLVLRMVCEATGWALGQAWLPVRDGRSLQWKAAWHRPDPRLARFQQVSQQIEYQADEGLPGRVYAARAPLWLSDLGSIVNSPRSGVAREVGILGAVGIPVLTDDTLVAVIEFFLLERRAQDERMIKLFSAIAAQLGGVIQRKRAEQELQANEEQFRVARDIQERLFPVAPPSLPGFEIAGRSEPASAAGGDYFDYLPMLQERWGVVVGDVTGHGIGPALLMAETRAYLRVLAQSHQDLGEILTHANRVLAEDIGIERFITMLLVSLDPVTRTLYYANAGHPEGFVLDARGQVKATLSRTGVPLGIHPTTEYPAAQQIQLNPGDIVLLLTDGIDEAVSPEDQLFGMERILSVVRERSSASAAELVEALYQAVRQFSGDAPQLDDATAVVVKVL
ncbi:MAG: SpoIIE family protein phosphatase [Verrucomicrobia bacterium]|nr:SpoIIE family protein phosphatase [Verrucomicrobiota bacterium]